MSSTAAPSERARVGSTTSTDEGPESVQIEIFVVDDDEEILKVLQRLLSREGYDVSVFSHPGTAFVAIQAHAPAVLITDQLMPEMTGLELAERALEIDPSIAVIIITGAGDETAAQGALKLGASDYLRKPIESQELTGAVRRAVMRTAEERYHRDTQTRLRGEMARTTEAHDRLIVGVLSALVNTLEARWEHFVGHSARVSDVAQRVARTIGLTGDQIEAIRIGGLLHDIGMVSVPDYVVEGDAQLSQEDYWKLQLHCQRGADILEPIEHLAECSRYILEHHERIDGSGYPLGLAGNAISLGGRIVGLAEAWSAMVEERSFRAGMSPGDAYSALSEHAGERFSPELVAALGKAEGLN